jgi:hypothetical protein
MIVFVTTRAHGYTHAPLVDCAGAPRVRVVAYEDFLAAAHAAHATYVFTDLDRLSIPDLRAAARRYRVLAAAGLRVLNDPARVRSRYGLLRALHRAGLNRFDVHRVESGDVPSRWPVFVRLDGTHEPPVTGLLSDAAALAAAVERAVAAGAPASALLVIEYAAEPVRPGLYRKLSVFRVGRASVAHTCVHDDSWLVKHGKLGVATPELYADELRIVRDNPYGPALARVFGLAGIDYGRADFGLVGGEIQTYEINSNPAISFPAEHPSPFRVEAYAVFRAAYLAALHAIDTPDGRDDVALAREE